VNIAPLRRHPVVAFVALSYLLSWFMLPFGQFMAIGPLIAAVAVVAATEGLAGLRRLAGHALRWRVSWVWYAVDGGPHALVRPDHGVRRAHGQPARRTAR
jgi:hypothetical protein